MITIDKLHTTYYYADKSKAQAVVDQNNRNDGDWRYELGESPRGYYIRVYDENGNVLGDL